MSKSADQSYHEDEGFEHIKLSEPVIVAPWDALTPPAAIIAESLARDNYCVFDGFLGREGATALRDEVIEYHAAGRMKQGLIGSGELRNELRNDHILWLEGNEPFVRNHMKLHIRRMDVLAQKLAILFEAIAPQHSWTGAKRCKIMTTVYKGEINAHYAPHYDNPDKNGRKLTTLLYLNPSWTEKDGGILRLKTNRRIVDVAPICDRMLFFWSDTRCPHEVLPAAGLKDRYAVTIWYLDEKERKAFEQQHASSRISETDKEGF